MVTCRLALAWTCALGLSTTGCDLIVNTLTSSFDTNDFSGDPYPTIVDATRGGLVIGIDDGTHSYTAVLDVLSPLTVIDDSATPQITTRTLTLLGERGAGGTLDLPRAQFKDAQVLSLQPCANAPCQIGLDGDPATPTTQIDAVFGMDRFTSDALRLDLADDPNPSQLSILPDIGGDEPHRSRACDAVFSQPFRGGGTLVVGGTELPFINLRIALPTCLAPDPDPSHAELQTARGADVLLVASTGLGVSLLSESAYARYQTVVSGAPDVSALPAQTVYLSSGPIAGHATTISSLAIASNWPSFQRAPCRQVYASHLLISRQLQMSKDCGAGDDCPCGTDPSVTCTAPAIAELKPSAGLPFLIVSDDEPTLQALRAELRPDQPEVDGILGTSALHGVELDIDDPHDRLLARCRDRSQCAVRPEYTGSGDKAFLDGCIGDALATSGANPF